MAKPNDQTKKLEPDFSFLLTEEQKKALDNAHKKLGVPKATYARLALVEKLIKEGFMEAPKIQA